MFLDSIFEEKAYQDIAFSYRSRTDDFSSSYGCFPDRIITGECWAKSTRDRHWEWLSVSGIGGTQCRALHHRAPTGTLQKTKLLLDKMGYMPRKMIFGDGYKGYVEQAPYDRILVTAGAPEVPKELLAQLKVGGRLVIPIGRGAQIMTVFVRLSPTEFSKEEYGTFGFVPMLEDTQVRRKQ